MNSKHLALTGSALLLLLASCARMDQPHAFSHARPPEAGYYSSVAPPPGAIALPDEEVWAIVRAADYRKPLNDDTPGSGELRAKKSEGETVPIPLKHTEVSAAIAGYIATVDVTQQYHNPFSEKIEAVYVFPLPTDAAVNEFVMTIGDRHIRGIIREREEARRVYEQARSQGHVASLMTQERPNVFTQSVANIEPGREIDINIKYFHTLTYDNGWYEFVFPMVVGPRYNPRGNTDGVGAVPYGQPGRSGQGTEVAYLPPGQRSGHDIGLAVTLDAGVRIESLRSVNHQVNQQRPTESQAIVRLDPRDAIPNKDFVLRYQVAGRQIKTAVLVHHDQRGGFFTMMLHPPADLGDLPRGPMEMIFVLDCSGSMNGKPIAQARAAVKHALDLMRPEDSFQIIRFSSDASQLGPEPLPATRENIARGKRYLRDLESGGGTEMIEGIRAALDFPHDPERLRTVAFLTDGYIGNEAEILRAVDGRLGASRIFSFGVGSSPNRYLLDGLARIGRGTVAYLSLNDDAGAVMDAYFQRVSHAALTDIEIDWGDLAASDVYPQRIPDLFVGRPVIVTGRCRGRAPAVVRVTGRAGGKPVRLAVNVSPPDATGHDGLPLVWARHKIADLAYRSVSAPKDSWAGKIRDVALRFALVSQYTSFVAVDTLSRTGGDHGTTVQVPVPVPVGVQYETTVE